MPRMGLGLGFGLVPNIIGDGSSNPLPELGLIAHYQARFNDLSLIPTNKVTGWDDSAGSNTLTQSTSSQMPTYVEGYKGVGDELVTNGDFATDSDWNKQIGWSISGGQASYNGLNGTSYLTQSGLDWEDGTKYILTIDVASNEGVGINSILFGTSNVISSLHLNTGIHEITGLKGGSNSVLFITGRADENFVINSVSVKLAERDTSLDTVNFDGADDNIASLPQQSGDFSYVFKGLDLVDSGNAQILITLKSNPTSASRVADVSGQFRLYFSDGIFVTIGGIDIYSTENLVLTCDKSTNELKVYGDGVLYSTIDLSGKSFIVDQIGRSTKSLNGSIKEFGVYDRALTLEEIEKI